MYDGALFATFNHQGGSRGETQVTSQNWLMGMAMHRVGAGMLRLIGMMSLEPLTVTSRGYAELFQVGETYQNRPLVDRQHPHDFVTQAAAIWRLPVAGTGVTLGGGPVGEATVGPPAYMHRASASDNPTAPLSHHTLDSTHVTNSGIVLAGVDRGPFAVEGSVFRGREPDENRWDVMDQGPLDSWAARAWFRQGGWTAQVSHAFLRRPEVFEAQDVRRTTASVSWRRTSDERWTAVTAAVGRNRRAFSQSYAMLVEGTHHVRHVGVFGLLERLDVESEHLLFPGVVHAPHRGELVDPVIAGTVGLVREAGNVKGAELSIGGDATFYSVPTILRAPYGRHPVSFHVYLRVRPASSIRMWDATMGRHP